MPGSAGLKALLRELLLNRNKNSHLSVLILERRKSIYWIMIGWWLKLETVLYYRASHSAYSLSSCSPPPFFFLFSCFLFLGWHFRVSALLPGQLFQKKEERWEVELMNTVINSAFDFVFKLYMFPVYLIVNSRFVCAWSHCWCTFDSLFSKREESRKFRTGERPLKVLGQFYILLYVYVYI